MKFVWHKNGTAMFGPCLSYERVASGIVLQIAAVVGPGVSTVLLHGPGDAAFTLPCGRQVIEVLS
jgi:hypothetical protein